MQAAVYSKLLKEQDIPYVQNLFDALREEGIRVRVYTPYLNTLKQYIAFEEMPGSFEGYEDLKTDPVDFMVTLGGDGTMLGAATLVRNTGAPILGINLGRLGFLASIEKSRIREAIRSVARGHIVVEERTLIHLESNLPLFGDMPFALNDFTLLKRDTSAMVTIHTYVDGAYLNTYWADGLIVATPTGSTGYSLSCGGPIIFPNSANFVITPVAPHNLNVRPIVIPDDSVISFEIEGRAENFLCTLDSRYESVTAAHQLAVRKCDFQIKLAQLSEGGFMETIRNKLAWGADMRNH